MLVVSHKLFYIKNEAALLRIAKQEHRRSFAATI